MNSSDSNSLNGIAIIGMDGKFPGAPNLEVFWENLRNGVESVARFEPEELEMTLRNDPQMVNARAIISNVDLFDADFFGFNPREAAYTDPQHRLFLQTAFEALENAGYDPDRYEGNIGLFAGCSQNTYLLANLASNPGFLDEYLASQQMGSHPALLGNDKDFLSTRVSYKLNLRGPSMTVQTACSTSLVAICQACQSLQNYQSDMALAGGVSITFPQKRGYCYEEGAIVSRDGHCRPFDISSDGTVFGDGVGVVVLKRVDDAIRDGDHIHAVIRGFAVNNDGSSKVSYMAPSVDGQAEVIATAQALAGVDAGSISYVEAHGTGTSLGDPIEVAALTKAFRLQTDRDGFCALGSVKGNFGHLEAAAGVAGLIKTALSLQKGEIPPSLHFSAPNPRIDFNHSPFYVNAKWQKWSRTDGPRRAGVSSFGVGGTNAHVVLEEAPPIPAAQAEAGVQLLTLSAKTAAALDRATERLGDYIRAHPETNLADAAYTLQVGRRAFDHRRVIVSASLDAALGVITSRTSSHFLTGGTHPQSGKKEIAFLFPGQGAQEVDMGKGLYESLPVYREQIDLCARLLQPRLGLDLREVLYPAEAAREDAQKRLLQTYLTQPALFVVEYALAQTWLKWGVRPEVLLGHSLGEYVAACLAGVFSLEDVLHLLAERGRLMQGLPLGSMLAVVLSEEEITPLLPEGLSLAAVNSSKVCVVSGPTVLTDAWKANLKDKGIGFRELATSHAFHSAMMDPILETYEGIVRSVSRKPAQTPIISTLFGRLAKPEDWTDPSYWSGQLRRTVRFGPALDALLARQNLAMVEVGPGQILSTLVRQHAAKQPTQAAVYSLPRKKEMPDLESMLAAAGQLWTVGVDVDWSALPGKANPRRIPLPAYPFELKRHWIERKPSDSASDHIASATEVISGSQAQKPTEVQTDSSSVEPVVTSTSAAVRAVFESLSGRDLRAADSSANFFDLGFDSLLLTQASQSLRQKFGVKISFRELMESLVTLEAVAKYVDEHRLASKPGVSVPVVPTSGTESADQVLPLTEAQQGLWLLAALNKNAERAYRDSLTISINGDLNRDVLGEAVQAVVDRHGALRTTIDPDGHTQTVHARHKFQLDYFDYSSLPADQGSSELKKKLNELETQTFADMNGPFLLATLLKVEAKRHLLVFGFHHIVGNGPSYWLFMDEVASVYQALSSGGQANLPPVFPFAEFVEKRIAKSRNQKEAEQFWLKQMEQGVPLLDLPFDHAHPAEISYSGERQEIVLEPELNHALRKIGAAQHCSLFIVLLSAYGLLLHRLSSQDVLFIGVPSDSFIRTENSGRHLFANSTNTLPLKSTLWEESTFVEYMLQIRHSVLAGSEHQDYFFGNLAGRINLPRVPGRALFFNTIFNLETAEFHREFPGLEMSLETRDVPYRTPHGISMFDLSINAAERKNGEIITQCDYNSSVIAAETMERWLACYHTLLRNIESDPHQQAASIPLFAAEKRFEPAIDGMKASSVSKGTL